MLWPDMTWVFIISYDIWNFCYTYNCLPTHSWYCGLALLLAPTVAGMLWNKGGWSPEPRLHAEPVVHVLPGGAHVRQRLHLRRAVGEQPRRKPGRSSVLALAANVAAVGCVAYRAKKLGVNPYKHEVFVGTKDYEKAMARREDVAA